ncbi:MAG: hypothetical protein ACKOAX_12705, partial [Candidatus Kapaibacterium sp.]
MKPFLLVALLCVAGNALFGYAPDSTSKPASGTSIAAPAPVDKKWYDNISLRGYTQFRYNRLLETNPNLGCEQCDRSWGKNGGFFFRRVRMILFGQIHKNVYLYLQPDFGSSAATDRNNF